MKLSDFNFDLPKELIAKHPVKPRHSSKLLHVMGDAIEDLSVLDLPKLIAPNDLIVFNNTKVIPAKMIVKRGEAKVTIYLNKQLSEKRWIVFAKPGKRLKIDDNFKIADGFSGKVISKNNEEITVDFEFDGDFSSNLDKYGQMPLPPYMKRESNEDDKEDYQTIYAETPGSVASPTAGLHFSDKLMKELDRKNIKRTCVTLHVGTGTFLPVKTENIDEHVMHYEQYHVSKETADLINETKKNGGRIICVGTTSVRTLESCLDEHGFVKSGSGNTNIFIKPGYTFKVVDILMTNFHLPHSTLLMLVSAFAGYKQTMNAYKHAVDNNYRFFSYGDSSIFYRAK